MASIRTFIVVVLFFLVVSPDLPLYGQGDGTEEYKAIIAKADEYFKKGDYINAKSSYQYASRMNPDEAYPKERLEVTIGKLREKMARMDEYTEALTEADDHFRKKEFEQAIEKYREAAKIIPSEGYPEEKIREIEGAKDEERKKKIAYDDAIYRADKYVKYRKYEEAIASYQKAADLQPAEDYPRERIEELEGEMEMLVQASKEYDNTINEADRLYDLKYYENARSEYQKALDARPDEDYPKSMITEIDALLVERSAYDKLVEAGDADYMEKRLAEAKGKYQQALKIYPSESYPRDMIGKINDALKEQGNTEELYNASIASADKFFAAGDYTNAIQEYENAGSLKPKSDYPGQKIDEINAILLARETLEQDYAMALKTGDQYLEAGSINEAKKEFEKALELKPGEAYPTERLAVVMNALKEKEVSEASYKLSVEKGDQFLADGALDEAMAAYTDALTVKPGDPYALAKKKEVGKLLALAEQDAVRYTGVIAEADQLLKANQLTAARDKYEQAQGLNPSETYPGEKIALIDERLDAQRTKAAAYNQAIGTADIFYNKKDYARAKEEYEKALEIKPGEAHPQRRLSEIASMGVVTTTVAAAAVQVPQGDEYKDAIKEANEYMGLQEYSKARLLYLKASHLKPDEQYPIDKIAEIDAIVGKQESDQAEYNRLVAAADRMLESGDYDKAKQRYNQALEILPVEQYPREKLKEIEGLILSSEINVQKTYNNLVEEADKLFNAGDYEPARIKYQNALKYKPGEAYPGQKIAEIDQLSSDLKKKSDQYNRLILEADNAFTSKEYQEAKTKYAEASALFPDEEHPRTRLEEINVIIRSSNQNAMQAYDKTIADADKFLSSGAYGQALDAYRRAGAMMPDESYPPEMIEKILKILNDNAFRKLLTSSKSIQNNDVEKYSFDPISVSDRKGSVLVIRARGMGIRDFKVFVSYGKGNSKKGGFIMPVSGGEEMKEYVFELGNQYTWFSEDNNWISLTPQGGSIEVTLVEIAKSASE